MLLKNYFEFNNYNYNYRLKIIEEIFFWCSERLGLPSDYRIKNQAIEVESNEKYFIIKIDRIE